MDDRRAEVALGAVIGGLDVVATEEDVQAIAVRTVALLEPGGLGLRSDVANLVTTPGLSLTFDSTLALLEWRRMGRVPWRGV
jgi:hypothetical protein